MARKSAVWSKEARAAAAERMRQLRQDPAFRANHSAAMADPEVRARYQAALQAMSDPAVDARCQAALEDVIARYRSALQTAVTN